MSVREPEFTLGVEEEYLLVDKDSRALIIDPPKTLLSECEEHMGDQVTTELLRSQIEVGTRVCKNIREVREDLSKLRRCIIDVAGRHDLAPIAASTHPFSEWAAQKHTKKDRYDQLTDEMQGAARRLLICGMHVHVGIDDDDQRLVDVRKGGLQLAGDATEGQVGVEHRLGVGVDAEVGGGIVERPAGQQRRHGHHRDRVAGGE